MYTHRTAPLAVLEAMSVGADAVDKTTHGLLSTDNVSEAVVLSTCNRTEIYAVAEKFHGGYADIRAVLAELAFLDPADFTDHLYVHHDSAAVAHLFSVVAGLDSAVIGEHEIQGQVKTAWEAAVELDAVGPTLNLLFRHALTAGKRVRTETAIGSGTASVSYAAVAMAAEHLGGLTDRRAVVLGAGDMGGSMAANLVDGGIVDLALANRTFDTAVERAARHEVAHAVRFSDVTDALVDADVVLTSTGAPSVLLGLDDMVDVMDRRHGRPLLCVDIAVPRDIDPAVAELAGVTVLDMADITRFAEAGLAGRLGEVDAARAVIDDEVNRFHAATSAQAMAPTIVALRDAAESTRSAELDRVRSRLRTLDADQFAAVDAFSQSLVSKLLHQPTIALRESAGTAKGDRLIQALRDLFDIDATP